MKQVRIGIENANKRMDLTMMGILPDLTRNTVKKVIIEGIANINGRNVMPNYRLKEGEIVLINEEKLRKLMIEDTELTAIKPKDLGIEVIYEDENIMVVNKPSGIHSHPVTKFDSGSVLNGIYFIAKQKNPISNPKIRLIHRLDKDTSGVLIASKSLEANDYYSNLFETRRVKKEYVAIVHGDFEKYLKTRGSKSIELTSFIGKSPYTDKKLINTTREKGKYAKSTIYFVEHFNKFGKRKFSKVKIVPETGRTHQIRVHLSSIGFPLLGDKRYNGQKYKRIMLHCNKITLPLMGSGKIQTFTSELPEKFNGL